MVFNGVDTVRYIIARLLLFATGTLTAGAWWNSCGKEKYQSL